MSMTRKELILELCRLVIEIEAEREGTQGNLNMVVSRLDECQKRISVLEAKGDEALERRMSNYSPWDELEKGNAAIIDRDAIKQAIKPNIATGGEIIGHTGVTVGANI